MKGAEYCSMGSLLNDMHSLFPPALIGDSGWRRILALTNRLPVHTTCRRFGFESDLCDENTMADFCVVVPSFSELASFYKGLTSDIAPGLMPPGFATFLTRQEEDPQSLLARTDSTPVLEYDLAAAPAGQHGPPGVFIIPRTNSGHQFARIHDEPGEVMSALESIAGWEHGAIDMDQVKRAWAAVAGAGTVSHAGVMAGRNPRGVRLIIQSVRNSDVAEVLQRLQWDGEPSLAESALSGLAGLVRPSVGLSIDITSQGVSPRVGLELFRPVEGHRTDRAGWKLLCDRLVDNGWCLPAKAGGLAEWPDMEVMFGRDGAYQVRQTINHIKLVIIQGAVSVKGYVAMDILRTT